MTEDVKSGGSGGWGSSPAMGPMPNQVEENGEAMPPSIVASMLNHMDEDGDDGKDGNMELSSSPTIESIPKNDEGIKRKEPPVSEEDQWYITRNDIPLSSSAALKVMDKADIVLQKRLVNAIPEELDVCRFEASIARFSNSEIELGRRLAYGNFADIYSIQSFRPFKSNKNCTDEQLAAAEEVKQLYNPKSLVVKLLRAQLLGNPGLYATGASDILTEGTLLATLEHPNIMRLRGRSLSSVEGFASGKRDAFFLIFERVDCNLSDKLREWQQRSLKTRPLIIGRREEKSALLLERLGVLVQIADALAYLHDKRIIHRDLKLSNIGMRFGQAILLDFGLAKVLPQDRDQDGMYLLTGNTGSLRYMAPEVARNEPYNLKADVFSFSILIFEVLNLSKAWFGYQPQEIRTRVLKKQRPPLSMFWPSRLRDLLKSTWSDLPAARLSVQHVHTILSKQIEELLRGKFMES